MKFTAHVLLSVAVVVVLAAYSGGQQSFSPEAATSQEIANPHAPASCPHLFTAGKTASNAYIQYCVNDNGNITSIETPFGHIHTGPGGEGYGLCQESPAIEYHDWLVDSANWAAANVLSVNGSTIKISRTTSDGNWTLVQTISKVAATGSIKLVMALTNNQNVAKVAYLVRFAHFHPNENRVYAVGASLQSTFAWDGDSNSGAHQGVQLRNAGKWAGYQQGFIQDEVTPPNACAFAFNALTVGVLISLDPTLVYAYADTVPAHGTKTVTMIYSGT